MILALDKNFLINKSLNLYVLSFFLRSMWYLPYLCTIGSIGFPLKLGKTLFKTLDQG